MRKSCEMKNPSNSAAQGEYGPVLPRRSFTSCETGGKSHGLTEEVAPIRHGTSLLRNIQEHNGLA